MLAPEGCLWKVFDQVFGSPVLGYIGHLKKERLIYLFPSIVLRFE